MIRWSRLALVMGLLLSCANPHRVAAFGDSLTSGGDWFGVFRQPPWTLLDHGQPGDKCWNDVADRFLAAAPELEADGVETLVIFCGTNDVRYSTWTLERDMVEIRAMAEEAQARGMDVVLVVPPPILRDGALEPATVFNARLIELRAALYAYGAAIGAPVADVWQTFWNHPDPESLYSDGVHPVGEGRTLMGATIMVAMVSL